jgi:hypothetical protein
MVIHFKFFFFRKFVTGHIEYLCGLDTTVLGGQTVFRFRYGKRYFLRYSYYVEHPTDGSRSPVKFSPGSARTISVHGTWFKQIEKKKINEIRPLCGAWEFFPQDVLSYTKLTPLTERWLDIGTVVRLANAYISLRCELVHGWKLSRT